MMSHRVVPDDRGARGASSLQILRNFESDCMLSFTGDPQMIAYGDTKSLATHAT
jgi:hypothetical protein